MIVLYTAILFLILLLTFFSFFILIAKKSTSKDTDMNISKSTGILSEGDKLCKTGHDSSEKSDSSSSVSSSSQNSEMSDNPNATDDIGIDCSKDLGYDTTNNEFATSTSSSCSKLPAKVNDPGRNESTGISTISVSKEDSVTKDSNEIGNDPVGNDLLTSSSKSCLKTSTDNQSTDSTKNVTVLTGESTYDSAIKNNSASTVLTSKTTNKTTNDPAINKDEDTAIISTTTTKPIILMNDFIDCTQVLKNIDSVMTSPNNQVFNYDMNSTHHDTGNSTPTKPAAVIGDTINNSLFSPDSSTTNRLDSTGSTLGKDDTNADARNSTTTKPAEASGNTMPSDKIIDNCPFSTFELDLYALCLFLKDTVVNGSKKVLVSPQSNFRRVLFNNFIKRLDDILEKDSLLNISVISCSLYRVEENLKGTPVQSLYDVMDNEGNTYMYTVPSESAHRVNFLDSQMKNIEDVKAFFNHIRQYKLYNLQGLQDFTKAMKLDISVENVSDYLQVRKAFQAKYGIYMAFIDGNHRITIAALVLGIIEVSSDTYEDTYVNIIDRFKLMIQQSFTTWIHMNYDNSLLSPDRMLRMSSQIKIMQKKSFGGEFSDIVNMCKVYYDSSKHIHNDVFSGLNEDNWLKISWLKPSAKSKMINNTKPCIVGKLQNLIVPKYLELISSHSFFAKDLEGITGEKQIQLEKEKTSMLCTALKQEFRPVTHSTYTHPSSKLVYPLAIKSNLHLLTVASYDPDIFDMLQNLTNGNFNIKNIFPQCDDRKEFITYDTIEFSMVLHKSISCLVELPYNHLQKYLSNKQDLFDSKDSTKWKNKMPRLCKFKQMLFIHFLKEILPVFLRLGDNPKIPDDSMKWLNDQQNSVYLTPSSGTGTLTIPGKLLFCFLRLYSMLIQNMESSHFAEKYYDEHKSDTKNSISTGVIKLKFEDIKVSNRSGGSGGSGEFLPIKFDEFTQDMLFNRKFDLYRNVRLPRVKIRSGQFNKKSKQEDLHESNSVPTEVSTQPSVVARSEVARSEVAQRSEEDQQENFVGFPTESQASSKQNKKKRRSTSPKCSSIVLTEPINQAYQISKKLKQDIMELKEQMTDVPDYIKEQLEVLSTNAGGLTDLIFDSGAIRIDKEASTEQKRSVDIGSNTD